MRGQTLLLSVLLGASSMLPSCRPSRTPDQSIAALKDPSEDTRQSAADELRTDEGVPPNAVQPLLDAYKTEQVPKVRGAILITLGRSGRPEAKPVIDDAVQRAADKDSRRWAARALKYWMIQTGKLSETYQFPDGWPYGQPGYPQKLPEGS